MISVDDAAATHRPYVVQGATIDAVAEVARNVRFNDRFEAACFGTSWDATAPNIVAAAKDVWTAYIGERPVFIFGTVEILNGVRQLFGFGTDKTKRVMPAVTWFTKTYWLPEMFESGVRRIQVHVPMESRQSMKWLLAFGMYCECMMPDYAINGAQMAQLAFTRNEFQKHVLFQDTGSGDRPSGDRTSADEVERRHSS